MDASMMQGSDKNAGAVGGLSTIKNPITAAIAVKDVQDRPVEIVAVRLRN